MGDHQVDKTLGVLREFASYSFVFAPTFLIFVIESVWSLKTWQAVRKLPQQVPKNASPPKNKWDITTRGGLALVFYMSAIMVWGFWGFKIQIFDRPEPSNMNLFYLITLSPPLVYLLGNCIGMYLGFSVRAVSRVPSGHVTLQVKNVEGYSNLLCSIPYILALAPVVASFVFKSRVLLAFDVVAITHFLVSSGAPRAVVGKHMAIAATLTFVYFAVLTTASSLGRLSFTIDIFPKTQDGQMIGWPQLILSCFGVAWPFSIIAACHRFDHFNTISPIALSISQDAGARPSDVMFSNDNITKISVQSPSREEFNFPRPYFCAALMGWLASFLLVALIAVVSKTEIEPVISGCFANYLSPAVMAFFIGLVSISRKETKKLLEYREDWFIKPKPVLDEEASVATSQAVEKVEPDFEKGKNLV